MFVWPNEIDWMILGYKIHQIKTGVDFKPPPLLTHRLVQPCISCWILNSIRLQSDFDVINLVTLPLLIIAQHQILFEHASRQETLWAHHRSRNLTNRFWIQQYRKTSTVNCFTSRPMCFCLTPHNWQKWKRVFLTCSCHKIYRVEAVGLKTSNYTWKNMFFANMWNLGQFREKLIFCQ